MSTPKRYPLTQQIKEVLATVTGLPVGVSSAPETSTGVFASPPYIVVYPELGGSLEGEPFCGGTRDANFHYQIDVFGEAEHDAEFNGDLVRDIILGRDEFNRYKYDIQYPDHRVMLRSIVGPAGRLVREGQVYRHFEDYSFRVTSRV
jgi:hypothetical protein